MKIIVALLIVILLVVFFSHFSQLPQRSDVRVPVGQVVLSAHPEAGLANQIIAYESACRSPFWCVDQALSQTHPSRTHAIQQSVVSYDVLNSQRRRTGDWISRIGTGMEKSPGSIR